MANLDKNMHLNLRNPEPEVEEAREARATAAHYYQGALVGLDGGVVHRLGAVEGAPVYGLVKTEQESGTSEGRKIHINKSGPVVLGVTVTGVTSAADKGRSLFLETDNVEDVSLVYGPEKSLAGEVYEVKSANLADIKILSPDQVASKLKVVDLGSVTLSAIGSYAAGLTLSDVGRVIALGATVVTAATGSSAEGELVLSKNGSALTGTLTLAVAALTPAGAKVSQAVTANAAALVQPGDVLSVAGTKTTTFTGGVARIWAVVEAL
jgi:hypothetical protein